MTRVEWTRLEGNDVEAVVAMLINREHPRSVRITPSRGDGGVDILDRGAAPEGGDIVYQVKRYTTPLTSAQKDEVESSLRRLLGPSDDNVSRDPRWAQLNVQEWHLVTPWDPTPEAESWLQDLGSTFGLSNPIWDGLTRVEQLTSKYPDVIDYYLHGARERIADIQKEIVAMFTVGNAASELEVPATKDRIQHALRALDHDPHYRYELRFGAGELPYFTTRPNLMISYLSKDAASDEWAIVDVIARCAASSESRPITISGSLRLAPGGDEERNYRDFVDFGAPYQSPERAWSGTIDAPGGIGGKLGDGSVQILSGLDIGHNPELHLEILDPEMRPLGAVNLVREERSAGLKGVRVVLKEENDIFEIEDRYTSDGSATRVLRLGSYIGKPVTVVAPAMSAVSYCRKPNVGRISVRHSPTQFGVIDRNIHFLETEKEWTYLGAVREMLDTLNVLQAYTPTVLRAPDLEEITKDQLAYWQLVAALLQHGSVTNTYSQGSAITVELDEGIQPQGPDLHVHTQLQVKVGQEEVSFGTMRAEFRNFRIIQSGISGARNGFLIDTPDRLVTFRFPVPDHSADEND